MKPPGGPYLSVNRRRARSGPVLVAVAVDARDVQCTLRSLLGPPNAAVQLSAGRLVRRGARSRLPWDRCRVRGRRGRIDSGRIGGGGGGGGGGGEGRGNGGGGRRGGGGGGGGGLIRRRLSRCSQLRDLHGCRCGRAGIGEGGADEDAVPVSELFGGARGNYETSELCLPIVTLAL